MAGKESAYLEELKRRASVAGGSQMGKVTHAPVRMLWSKALEIACLRFGLAVKAETRTFWGGRMTVVFPEMVSCFLYRYGFFEENLTTIFINYLKKDTVFFDIGTHFGYFSLLASELVGEGGQVHSFEPTPSTFGVLSGNLAGRNNVYLNNMALWSEETTLDFQDYGIRYSAFNSLYGAKCMEVLENRILPTTHRVKTKSVDGYIAETGAKPGFIKIDAESAEFDILQGMERTLADVRPIVTMEVGDFDDTDIFKDSKDSVVFLMERKYRAYEFADGRIVEHKPRESYRYNNLLFIPQ